MKLCIISPQWEYAFTLAAGLKEYGFELAIFYESIEVACYSNHSYVYVFLIDGDSIDGVSSSSGRIEYLRICSTATKLICLVNAGKEYKGFDGYIDKAIGFDMIVQDLTTILLERTPNKSI